MSIQLNTIKLSNNETYGYRVREGGERLLLLIHGNMTSSKHWDIFMEALSYEYKVIALDLRGFGLSSYQTPISSIKDFSDDVKLFVDELELKDFTLMGWSTGGAVAMQFEIDYPGLATELILLASASTRGYPFYGVNEQGQIDLTKRYQSLDEIKQDPVRSIPIQHAYDHKNREFLKAVWNAVIYNVNQPPAEKYEEYVDDMLTQRNLVDVYHALNTFNISSTHNGLGDGTGLVTRIAIPTLVLSGDRDLVVSKAMNDEIIADLNNEIVTAKVLKNCGHSAPIDDLEQLTEAVTTFLNMKVEEAQ
ncbi:pimeloyl-ACP methyl ester carboxylesterase [Bacillus mesophilus]|uniref:Alpha/beta hydrolase n=1 Tax=Bacillus mesophilus TaxID=1808955 RepID=A0A6M0Q5F8_9BACI|nr:alpha/beta hydrolase [Bacillus mesophilus]MBM7659831.1 pimeloyl-ACP methyl ester carboxylesterase [Bacillus mesophilus]NEY70690.1 alpha/beta hydrolase [Bacillus mesophilus]